MMPRSIRQSRARDGRGQVLVLFAMLLVVLLLISALAIDYGAWLVARRNYQNLSDAASLTGAQLLTRPLSNGCVRSDGTTVSKNECAREAAWESVKKALNLGLDAASLAAGPSSTPHVEAGYSIWVASPPADAGAAWLGRITGPGVVYVRVEHEQPSYFSRLAGIGRTVTSWATAGRFPANFAVIGMCRPAAGDNCLANESNIIIDGNGTYLAVETGDVGTNAWVKTNGNGAALGLGADSNAYMEEFTDCWDGGQQCELVGYAGGALQYSDVRTAIPLGAPIVDPGYAAPPINNTTAPNQCQGTGTVQLASVPSGDRPALAAEDLPIRLTSDIIRDPNPRVANLVPTNNDIVGFVEDTAGNRLSGINVSLVNGGTTYADTTAGGGNLGRYRALNVESGTYVITADDPTGTYHRTSATPDTVIPTTGNATFSPADINMPRNPVITGTVRNSVTNAVVAGASITITGPGGPFTTTTNGSGVYTQIITTFGTFGAYDVTASAASYTDNTVNSGLLALDTTTTVNIALTPAPASLTGTITDQVTTLPVPGVIVTLGTGETTTTNAAGFYDFPSLSSGTTTVTLSGTSMDGYAFATPPSPATVNLSGNTTRNFTVFPQGCDASGSAGDWDCGEPSGDHCAAVINPNGVDVSCTFTQANAIRPGTYDDISIDGCAWLDPTGGVTGLAAGQMAGIYHIKGSFTMSNNSYIFGDGVTLVFDQGAEIDVQNSGGFVLNYGTVKFSGTPGVCDPATDFSTQKLYADGNTPCFRTVPVNDGMDYAYAAWTTKGNAPWTCTGTSNVVYDDSCVAKGTELGITFYAYGNGYGNATRFRLNTAGMGYLFNGVMYGPNDDIDLGGGHNSQNAAGQIVGWTITYHGGTKIVQNWYGDPIDGPPFLIEPILGE
jgi:hypothetical protein